MRPGLRPTSLKQQLRHRRQLQLPLRPLQRPHPSHTPRKDKGDDTVGRWTAFPWLSAPYSTGASWLRPAGWLDLCCRILDGSPERPTCILAGLTGNLLPVPTYRRSAKQSCLQPPVLHEKTRHAKILLRRENRPRHALERTQPLATE